MHILYIYIYIGENASRLSKLLQATLNNIKRSFASFETLRSSFLLHLSLLQQQHLPLGQHLQPVPSVGDLASNRPKGFASSSIQNGPF